MRRAAGWLRASLAIARLGAELAPADERRRCRDQWEADLTHQWLALERAGLATGSAGGALLRRSAGAWAHAAWLRFRIRRLDMLLTDLRYAVRVLVHRPFFTLLATLTLGLGMAANAVIFSWVDALLLNPLGPVADQRSVAVVTFTTAQRNSLSFSYPNFQDARAARGGALEDVAVFSMTPMSLRTGDGAERVWGELFSGNMFGLLRLRPALGRLITEDDTRAPGTGTVAVLSHDFWLRRFGGRPDVVGQVLVLNNRSFTVVGVAAPGFQGTQAPLGFDVFVPVTMTNVFYQGDRLNDRQHGWLQGLARVGAGHTLAETQAQLDVLAARLAKTYPDSNEGRGMRAFPLWRAPNGGQNLLMPAFAVLGGIVGLLLLLVCANLAGLLLARAAGRTRELALRHALGASRARLVRQLLVESLVLAVLGGLVGLVAARWSGDLLAAFLPPLAIPISIQAGLSLRVAIFTFGLSLVAGCALGLLPAWQSSRVSVRASLQEGSGASVAWRRGRLRQGLVVAQVAVALVLLSSAALFVRSMREARRMDAGFSTRQGLMGAMDLMAAGYDRTRGRVVQQRLLDEVRAVPGVAAAALARRAPLTLTDSSDTGVQVEGYQPAPREEMSVFYNQVSDGFFETLGITLVEGRGFTRADGPESPRVMVISETMARRYWPTRSAIGGRVRQGGEWATVIGVARDGKYGSMSEDPRPFMYLPLTQVYRGDVRVIVRTAGAPGPVTAPLRAAVARVDPALPLFEVTTIEEHVAFSFFLFDLLATLLGVFGIVATGLAALGLYGVMALSIAQRTREIGVRLSLGASARDVVGLVLRQGLRLVAIGVVLGLALAFGAARLMASQLVGVSPFDAAAFGATITVVLATTALACLVPAQSAIRIDPLVAMRRE
jgi:macrolide transport system ATP-binding/permease protein